jgi:small subunit ribosomal protein S3
MRMNLIIRNKILNYNPLVSISFINLSYYHLTASLLTKYIAIKIIQGYTLRELLHSVLLGLNRNPTVRGYKILCCGRFTNEEMASYELRTRGKFAPSTVDFFLDYGFAKARTRYGMCGIKLWLALHKRRTITRGNYVIAT